MKRPVRFELRLSHAEHRAAVAAAKRAQRTLSDWARIELARAADRAIGEHTCEECEDGEAKR